MLKIKERVASLEAQEAAKPKEVDLPWSEQVMAAGYAFMKLHHYESNTPPHPEFTEEQVEFHNALCLAFSEY